MNREETDRALELYAIAISRKTSEVYEEVDNLLKSLIVDTTTYTVAKEKLEKAFERALIEKDFKKYFTKKTIKIVSEASYNQAVLNVSVDSKADYTRNIPRVSMFDDEVTLSKRIRKNYNAIVKDQKIILDKALKDGKGIVDTARKINNAGGFDPELPKYIKDLQQSKIAGKKLSKANLNRALKQADKIKSKGLKQNYKRLINAIDIDKNVDKAIEKALVSKSKSFAERLAKSEVRNTQAAVKIARHAQDKNVKFIYSITSGANPCNFCLAMQDLGPVPFESAPKALFHPNCSCTLHVIRSLKDVKKWTQGEYEEKFNKSLDKFGKTYVGTTELRDLRVNTINDKLERAKNK